MMVFDSLSGNVAFGYVRKHFRFSALPVCFLLCLYQFTTGFSSQSFAKESDDWRLVFYKIILTNDGMFIQAPPVFSGERPGISDYPSECSQEGITHIDHESEAMREYAPENIDYSLGFARKKFRSFLTIMSDHKNNGHLAEAGLCYRGDSRSPAEIWQAGGFWAIEFNELYKTPVRGNGQYSVLLHQSSPRTQDVVSTSTAADVGKRFSIPLLKQSGFNHAIWNARDQGVSLKNVNRDSGTLASYNPVRDKVLRDEDEVAFIGGIPRSSLLAARSTYETPKEGGASWERNTLYGEEFYLNRRLLLGLDCAMNGEEEEILKEIFQKLLELSPEQSLEGIERLRTQILSGRYL